MGISYCYSSIVEGILIKINNARQCSVHVPGIRMDHETRYDKPIKNIINAILMQY